jgi:hypothetical protein
MICVSFEMQHTAASNLPPIVQRLLAFNEVLAKRTTFTFHLEEAPDAGLCAISLH